MGLSREKELVRRREKRPWRFRRWTLARADGPLRFQGLTVGMGTLRFKGLTLTRPEEVLWLQELALGGVGGMLGFQRSTIRRLEEPRLRRLTLHRLLRAKDWDSLLSRHGASGTYFR
jgi:hypothetical protein